MKKTEGGWKELADFWQLYGHVDKNTEYLKKSISIIQEELLVKFKVVVIVFCIYIMGILDYGNL